MSKIAFFSVLPTNSKLENKCLQVPVILRFGLAIFLMVSTASVALAQIPARPQPQTRQPSSLSGTTFSSAAATVATTTSMAVLDDTRKLGIGDVVSFRVVEDRDPPVSLIITDSGEMEVPYIGRVRAAGRTCKNLALSIKSSLEVDYYYRATVIIGLDSVSQASRGRIYVSGEVLNQGAQEIPPNEEFTASKALANSGGFSKFANKSKIRIIRKGADGNSEIILFNHEKFQTGSGPDVPLQPNDTINVRARAINFGGG